MQNGWMKVVFSMLMLGSTMAQGVERSPRISIDRFEGEQKEIAVLVGDDGELQIDFPRVYLPSTAKGGVLIFSVKNRKAAYPRVEEVTDTEVTLALDPAAELAHDTVILPRSFVYKDVKVGDVVRFWVDWRATKQLQEETQRTYEELNKEDPTDPN